MLQQFPSDIELKQNETRRLKPGYSGFFEVSCTAGLSQAVPIVIVAEDAHSPTRWRA
jgi:hypothetical protein